ncbi:hypothetical protein [Streptomyces sp. AC495_CC817]|uniref:hypothetical protein n=1 Tax=Streptomyces sp. AC495_CC817 TaxID=2823900 RepID=UPI001C26F641|nr:hypothetical protein [Streptomyces sp. AC495_CC817]
MRAVAVIVGGLLLIGGAALVVSADQQRVHAIEQAHAAVDEAQRMLDAKKAANLELAETLTTLRSQIAAQDAQLSDTTGLLK